MREQFGSRAAVALRQVGVPRTESVSLLLDQSDAGRDVAHRVRQRLAEGLQGVHQRGQVHITTRELRPALAFILFGTHFCDDLHNDGDLTPLGYWDRAFDPGVTLLRQGELLDELRRFDPALDAHPEIDRYLKKAQRPAEDLTAAPRFPGTSLASARRRAYFEWLPGQINGVAGTEDALGLTRGQHLDLFRRLPALSDQERNTVCGKLCGGISRLEHLPRMVLARYGVVPLKILPRIRQSNQRFWIEKPLDRFQLIAEKPASTGGVEWLHNCLLLKYHYVDDREESLRLSSDLFSLLLDLADGSQLMDASTDDVFANLSIFTQRLAEEDQREVYAFEPSDDSQAFHIGTLHRDAIQTLTMSPVKSSAKEASND